MNRTLLRARIAIALFLLLGLFVLVGLLIYKPPTLSDVVRGIVEGAIAQLVILLGFVVHAIFSPGAQVPESPSVPNLPGPAAPKVQS